MAYRTLASSYRCLAWATLGLAVLGCSGDGRVGSKYTDAGSSGEAEGGASDAGAENFGGGAAHRGGAPLDGGGTESGSGGTNVGRGGSQQHTGGSAGSGGKLGQGGRPAGGGGATPTSGGSSALGRGGATTGSGGSVLVGRGGSAAGSGGSDPASGGTQSDCWLMECERAVNCVESCGGPVLQSSCCPCPEGTFDDDACLLLGGSSSGGAAGGGGTATGSGGSEVDCGLIMCERSVDCVESCGGPVLQSGCCPCPEGTFDDDACGSQGGSSSGGAGSGGTPNETGGTAGAAGTAGTGGGMDCEQLMCERPITCVADCDHTGTYNACCPCDEGTFDSYWCEQGCQITISLPPAIEDVTCGIASYSEQSCADLAYCMCAYQADPEGCYTSWTIGRGSVTLVDLCGDGLGLSIGEAAIELAAQNGQLATATADCDTVAAVLR